MPIVTQFRINAGVRMVLLFIIAGYIILGWNWSNEAYTLALMATSNAGLSLLVPLVAVCAAWEGGRLKRANIANFAPARTNFIISLWPTLLITSFGFFVYLIVLSVNLSRAKGGAIDSRLILLALALLFTHAQLGFAVGLRIKPVIALPLVLIGDYLWMSLLKGLSPLWLRHLNGAGSWFSCCDISSEIAPQIVMAIVITTLGLFTAAQLSMIIQQSVPRNAAIMSVLILAVGSATMLVNKFGPYPTIARRDPMFCEGSRPQVCVWPENQVVVEEATTIIADASEAWQGVGVELPTIFTQSYDIQDNNKRHFVLRQPLRSQMLIHSIASSLVYTNRQTTGPQMTTACASTIEQNPELLHAWLDLTAGIEIAELSAAFSPEIVTVAQQISQKSIAEQTEWFQSQQAASRGCQ